MADFARIRQTATAERNVQVTAGLFYHPSGVLAGNPRDSAESIPGAPFGGQGRFSGEVQLPGVNTAQDRATDWGYRAKGNLEFEPCRFSERFWGRKKNSWNFGGGPLTTSLGHARLCGRDANDLASPVRLRIACRRTGSLGSPEEFVKKASLGKVGCLSGWCAFRRGFRRNALKKISRAG